MIPKSDGSPGKSLILCKKSKGPEEQKLFGKDFLDKFKELKKKEKGSLNALKKKNTIRKEKPIKAEHDGLQSNDSESTDVLTYGKISKDMLILGCIKKIKIKSIECELPGQTFGEIPLQNVSADYLKLVHYSKVVQSKKETVIHSLADIFSVGQFVPVHVCNVEKCNKIVKVTLSTNPANVNSHLRHRQISVGNLIWGSISEKSDRGYLVDLGVAKTRTHLPFTSSSPQHKSYELGQVLFMSVTKIERTKETFTLTVSTLTEDINNSMVKAGSNLDRLIAGAQVDFTIENVLKNGLKGSFLGECKGYINELYLRESFDTLKNYKEGQKVKSRILFTCPISRISYLTLKPLSSEISKNIKIGSKLNCMIASKIDAGLIVKIDNKFRGLITNERLLKCISESEKKIRKTEELILEKFPLNSKQECTVLDYNHIESLYVCTFEKIDDYLSFDSFTIGQTVRGVVKKYKKIGIIVQLGNVDAFVHNNHLIDEQYSGNIKDQLKIGQKVAARVLSMDNKEEKLFLTMKPSLMKNKDNLMSYEDIVPEKKVYSGVVCSVSDKGVVVVFFGNVKGFLPSSTIPNLQGKISDMFFLGQVVKVCVASYTDEPVPRLSLILNKMPNTDSSDEGIYSPSEDNDDQEDKEPKIKLTKKKRKAAETIEKLSEKAKKKKKTAKVDPQHGAEDKKEEVDEKSQTNIKRKKEKLNATEKDQIDKEPKQKKKKKVKTVTEEQDTDDEKVESFTKKPKKSKETLKTIILPGMSSFFNVQCNEPPKPAENDDDDAEDERKKSKKMSPAERALQRKLEEERLRRIENELADASVLPQSAEQFDRALLGNPEDSELWTRYIAFHIQSTEFEKARGVARLALSRIPFTSCQERLNIWLAYLNLENMYGTKESFDGIFEEAARSNDALTVYLETVKMLCDMQKWTEMDEKIKKARGKFKQELGMWLEIGKVYYQCKRFVEARKLKDNALLTLIDKKSHIQVIVQFALMEFNLGEPSQGEALLEALLQVDPKRVDIWCTYIDQLVKIDKIDIARNVLKRAVGQKLPFKKMRTLYRKFFNFEKEHGDPKSQKYVKDLLLEYNAETTQGD